MTKSIENIRACNELDPLAMDLIGRLNTSEFVNGGMPPAKVSLRWSVTETFNSSSWTRGPNFVSSLYLHPYLCKFVTKANASLHRLVWVLVGRKCNMYPKAHVLAQICMDNPRHMRTVLFSLIQTTVYRST